MRKIAQELGVVPMALYKHVSNKDELLDGMVDVVVGEIDPPASGTAWKTAIRRRVLSARSALLRHPWASRIIESRTNPTPAVLEYMDSMIGIFRAGGFSIDLTHHAMHAMGSRLLGFTQELFDDTANVGPEMQADMPVTVQRWAIRVGLLIVFSAVSYDPAKATGMDTALKTLAGQPYGTVLLLVVAAGLSCFGRYCLFDARYRRG